MVALGRSCFRFRQLVPKLRHRKIIGLTIRRYRTRAKLSIELLAERADLHPNYVGEIERGEKAASVDTLVKVAEGLGVPPWKLLSNL